MKVALLYLNNDKLVSRGVGYLAMAIRDAGHSLRLYDTAWTPETKAVQQAVSGNFDAFLISCTSFYYTRAKKVAHSIKAMAPNMHVIVGGMHATILRERMLDDCPDIDYICVGEGEDFIVEFLDCLHRRGDISSVQNLGYRRNGAAVVNPTRPCTDLHTLKPFDFSLFNPGSVIRESGNLFPGFCYVFATRGCPYKCTYCCNGCYLDLYGASFLRTQKIDVVLEELRYLRAHYPIQLAYFGDEMILFDKTYVTELFTRIHDELQMPYGCMFRAEAVTPDIVDVMRKTGCRYVGVGIECGDEHFRRQYLNRRMSNKRLIDAFRLLRTIPNVWITTYNMRGFPVSYDSRLTAATRRLNRIVRADHAQTTWFFPIPGTRLHDYCCEHDLIDWGKYRDADNYFRRSVLKHPLPRYHERPIYA